MINKLLIGVNAILVLAVGFLFYKINQTAGTGKVAETKTEEKTGMDTGTLVAAAPAGNTPSGKIAFVNIDKINEKSLEIEQLNKDTKRRKEELETGLETLKMRYQKEIEGYQTSVRAGIAPESEKENALKRIKGIEQQIYDKQLQMDEFSDKLNEMQFDFHKRMRTFIDKWNAGKFDYILSYTETVPTMLHANEALEITNEVLAEMNKEYEASKTKK